MAFKLATQGVVDSDFIIGRKAICSFLDMSWGTVKRWKRDYGLPIKSLPNSKPVLRRQDAIAFLETVSK